jgi:hypothetical protein
LDPPDPSITDEALAASGHRQTRESAEIETKVTIRWDIMISSAQSKMERRKSYGAGTLVVES